MSEEEPAWRAELIRDLSKYDAYASQWLPLVEPHILAAEQRGRKQGLLEAAEAVDTDDAHPLGCAGDCYVCVAKADVRLLREMAESS